ncbi:GIY-YIG nuclease family protein [Candidatus Uhrbacteria bacterium]|nr:GIY-YIG nuclease family protein [Candidatus Uhrbacteria bacterium]
MYFLYIIGSIPTSRWYIGITEHTLKRLEQHNAGRTRSTKPYRPYKLIHEEKFTDKTEARKREIKVKRSGIIRKELKERLHGPIV